jgi:hypothetical protein
MMPLLQPQCLATREETLAAELAATSTEVIVEESRVLLSTRENSPSKAGKPRSYKSEAYWTHVKRICGTFHNDDMTHQCIAAGCFRKMKVTRDNRNDCWLTTKPNEHMSTFHPASKAAAKSKSAESGRNTTKYGAMSGFLTNVTPIQKSLSSQVNFVIYTPQRISKRTLDCGAFKNMLQSSYDAGFEAGGGGD